MQSHTSPQHVHTMMQSTSLFILAIILAIIPATTASCPTGYVETPFGLPALPLNPNYQKLNAGAICPTGTFITDMNIYFAPPKYCICSVSFTCSDKSIIPKIGTQPCNYGSASITRGGAVSGFRYPDDATSYCQQNIGVITSDWSVNDVQVFWTPNTGTERRCTNIGPNYVMTGVVLLQSSITNALASIQPICMEQISPTETATSACGQCLPGSYQTPAATCSACSGGSITTLPAQETCTLCPPGTYAPPASSECTQCAPGTFAPNTGSSACTSCPPDAGSVAGSTACTPCPPAQYFSPATSQCTPCVSPYIGYYITGCGGSSAGTLVQCTNVF